MKFNLGQRAFTEFVATAAVVFVAAGAVVAADDLGAFDAGSTVAVALAYGLVVAVVTGSVAHISGGHANPAITVGAFVTGRLGLGSAAAYLAAQLAGAAAGAGLLRAALPEGLWDPVALGTPRIGEGLGVAAGQAVLVESVLVFVVTWVFFAAVVDDRGSIAGVGGWIVGLAVAASVLMAEPFSGGALNPARAFGPAAVGGFWEHHWVFWVGPAAGAIVGAVAYDLAILRPREERAAAGARPGGPDSRA